MTVPWTWIVVGLLVLLLLGLVIAAALDDPPCPTCGGRIHNRACPWRGL